MSVGNISYYFYINFCNFTCQCYRLISVFVAIVMISAPFVDFMFELVTLFTTHSSEVCIVNTAIVQYRYVLNSVLMYKLKSCSTAVCYKTIADFMFVHTKKIGHGRVVMKNGYSVILNC